MIQIQDLSKRYGDRIAVNNLSFSIRPGHVTGFLGPNGAGKTTTMRLILGLDRPSAGSVTIDGTSGLGSGARQNSVFSGSMPRMAL